eukprot:6004866-Heterocapsa_arctica.AAC.1
MDSVVEAASRAASDSLGVLETGPIKPLPPGKPEEIYKPPEDADVAEMQSGVRKEEPAAPTKRWPRDKGNNWADQSTPQAIAEEEED